MYFIYEMQKGFYVTKVKKVRQAYKNISIYIFYHFTIEVDSSLLSGHAVCYSEIKITDL